MTPEDLDNLGFGQEAEVDAQFVQKEKILGELKVWLNENKTDQQ